MLGRFFFFSSVSISLNYAKGPVLSVSVCCIIKAFGQCVACSRRCCLCTLDDFESCRGFGCHVWVAVSSVLQLYTWYQPLNDLNYPLRRPEEPQVVVLESSHANMSQ